MSQPATYAFPWGTRPICPQPHERTIGGDGYGDRCCGTADVETVQQSSETCPRFFCELCCDERCCRGCHTVDVDGDASLCRQCAAELAHDRAELDAEERRVGLVTACCSNNCGGYCDGGQRG